MHPVADDHRRVPHPNLQCPAAIEEERHRGPKRVEAHVEKFRLLQGIGLGEGVRLRHSRVPMSAGVIQQFVDPHHNFQCHPGRRSAMVLVQLRTPPGNLQSTTYADDVVRAWN
jgi:hypothetical protein